MNGLESILSRLRALQPGICELEHCAEDRFAEMPFTVPAADVSRIADDLEHAIRELRADRDRLDWLERTRGVDCRHHDNDERHGFTLREAIDAACSTTGREDGDGE